MPDAVHATGIPYVVMPRPEVVAIVTPAQEDRAGIIVIAVVIVGAVRTADVDAPRQPENGNREYRRDQDWFHQHRNASSDADQTKHNAAAMRVLHHVQETGV